MNNYRLGVLGQNNVIDLFVLVLKINMVANLSSYCHELTKRIMFKEKSNWQN